MTNRDHVDILNRLNSLERTRRSQFVMLCSTVFLLGFVSAAIAVAAAMAK